MDAAPDWAALTEPSLVRRAEQYRIVWAPFPKCPFWPVREPGVPGDRTERLGKRRARETTCAPPREGGGGRGRRGRGNGGGGRGRAGLNLMAC